MGFSVVVLALFAACAAWAYRFVFDHDIIRNYAHRDHVSKAQFNAVADAHLHRKLGWRLLRLDVDGDGDAAEPARAPAGPGAAPPAAHLVVGASFSLTIALSLVLVGLLMAQLCRPRTVEVGVFRVVIRALVVSVSMVTPAVAATLYGNPDLVMRRWAALSARAWARTAVAVAAVASWHAALRCFGAAADFPGADTALSFFRRKTNELVMAGITITAALSGVASASTPVRTLWLDRARRPRSPRGAEARINELVQSYNSTGMLARKRRQELAVLRASQGGTVYGAPPAGAVRSLAGAGRGLLTRVQSFTTLPGAGASEELELAGEAAALHDLQEHIYRDLAHELARAVAGPDTSAWPALARVFDVCFAVYCVYRVGNVLLLRLPYHYFWSADLHGATNVIDDPESSQTLNKNTKDALAITVAKLIQGVFGYLPMSETQLINQVSFVLSGSLFVCSFQNVVTTFKSVGRFLPAAGATVDARVKSWLKNLVVSEFLAIYVIATALLIRSNLPVEAAEQLSQILSLSTDTAATPLSQMLTEVEFIDTWSDKVFGVSCVVTFLVLASKLLLDETDDYDEESLMEDNTGFKTL